MKTHADRIAKMLTTTASKATCENLWGARHNAAWSAPRGIEASIVCMLQGAAAYADTYLAKFEGKIGDDGVLGEPWADILRGVRSLLNGDCGRLDCGTLDALILDMLAAEGFEE